jgi:hypothetical protein
MGRCTCTYGFHYVDSGYGGIYSTVVLLLLHVCIHANRITFAPISFLRREVKDLSCELWRKYGEAERRSVERRIRVLHRIFFDW